MTPPTTPEDSSPVLDRADAAAGTRVRPSWDEGERLAALSRYYVLDTPREPEFDDVVRLAAHVFEAPIAVVNLIADGRQWFKAEVGIGADELPLDVSICAHAILQPGVFVVPDTTQDERFACNPLVTGEPGLRFYAGALLETPEGLPLGTVCVLDTKPRPEGVTGGQRLTLEVLARQVMTQLELRRALASRDAEIARAHASEERLRLVLDAARDYAIVTTDPERRITGFSAGAEAAFRMNAADAIGRSADELFTPEDRAQGRPEREAATAASKGCSNDERWHQRADGGLVFLNGSVHPLPPDEAGRERGFIKIARDETDRRTTDATLAESEERFRNLADHAPVMMWVTDPTGACLYLNRAWYEFTGQTREEAEGFGWLDATHPDDKAEAERVFLEANAAREPFRLEYRLRRADGTYRWTIDAASPRLGPGGEFLGYVGSVIDIDERRDMEDALRQTSRRLDAILSNTREAVFLMNERQHCVYANAAAEALTGYSFAEMQGRPLHDVVHHKRPDGSHYPLEECPIDRAFPERAQMSGEELFVHKDGSFYPVAFTASPVLDDEGKPAGTVIEARNIAEEKAADAARRESEALLNAVIDAMPVGVIVADAHGRIVRDNAATREIWGVPPETGNWEAYGEWEGYWPNTGKRIRAHEWGMARALLAGEIVEGELVENVRFDTGERRFFLNSAAPVRDADGRIIAGVVAAVDVTEQRAIERRLRESEARYRTLFETMDEGFCVVEFLDGPEGPLSDYIHVEANPAYTANAGIPDIVGKRLREIVGEDEADGWVETYRRVLVTGEPLRFERELLATERCLELAAFRVEPESKRQVAVLFKDVTARKRADNELRKLNETLEQRIADEVAERTKAEEALRQAQKMEAVGQLTGGIAHDFNNLLTGVIGSLDMMQRRIARGETDRIERYANAALTSANRAAALTHRLLAFSRRQPLDPKPVNANRLVTGMEELLRRTIGESVRLEIVTAGGLWQTLCDPHQLESAILNLAINARDAMPEGGTLTIETCNAHLDNAYAARSREVEPGQYVCICVTDTGTGMPRDVVEKAFDPFFTTKPIGQGTGLGLSMIYGFARQSEGYAKIYSEPGQGTTVKLYLPRYYGEAEEIEQERGRLTDEHRAAHGETVLVVEDETAVRALVVDVLEELGYRAVEATDGPAGLKVLQSNARVDLLVTDVGLPGLNGRQLADAARRTRPDLKVLFITGYAENAAISSGFLEPGMQMITKPFAIETLATRIRDMIESGSVK